MLRVAIPVLAAILAVSTQAQSPDPILPFPGAECRDIEAGKTLFKELDLRIYAVGDLVARGRMAFMVDGEHDHLYAFTYNEKEGLCLSFGGREVDLVSAEFEEKVKAKWGARLQRYHNELATRMFGGPVPITIPTIPYENMALVATWFFVKPGWPNNYDVPLQFTIKGEQRDFEQGEMAAVANRELAQAERGEQQLDERTKSDYQRIFKNTDHHLQIMMLVVDESDSEWTLVLIDRDAKTAEQLFNGKNFRFDYK